MEYFKDIEQDLRSFAIGAHRQQIQAILNLNRINIMTYLKDNVKRILSSNIIEVYHINEKRTDGSFRTNIIDLEVLLNTIQVKDKGSWGFEIYIDESMLSFQDSRGQDIYELNLNQDNREESIIVRTLKDYWQLPIRGYRESDFYTANAIKDIERFLVTDFRIWITKLLKGGR